MALFDTHCHLDDEQFAGDCAEILQRARDAGVVQVLTVGVTVNSSRACVTLAAEFPEVLAAVGIQPNHCREAQPDDWDRLCAMSSQARVAAIGETGLDRYWDFTPWSVQQDYFDRHLRLAQQQALPCVIHMRDCDAETLEMLTEARRRGPLSGIMHSFTGSAETARACLELGLHISFAGMVTYKKAIGLREIAATIPADRLLLETDAPYLSPHPCRSQKRNEPSLLIHTAACLAEVRGVPVEALAEQTTANAQRLLRARS
jgi:TatD DNase family protein